MEQDKKNNPTHDNQHPEKGQQQQPGQRREDEGQNRQPSTGQHQDDRQKERKSA
jgi:hypothetical protein